MSSKNKNIQDAYFLSPMQQGMLFHSFYEPASDVYLNQLSCDLHGEFNVSAFAQAWQQVVNRHPVLRTAFVWEKLEKPLQVVGRQVKLSWEEQDWRGVSVVEQQERLENLLHTDQKRGFELSKAPLMRLTLIQLTETTYHFVWSHHHLLLDGWSVSIIFEEVINYYQGFCQGQNIDLKPPEPYRDYIAWLQQQDMPQAEAFWRERLKGFTAPIQVAIRLPHQEENCDRQKITLSVAATAALQSLAQQQHLTLSTLIQGAWALLLSRYSGQEDIVFGVTVSGRPAALLNVESMVGLFINTLPMRVQVAGEEFLLPWLKRLQSQLVEARQYEYSPLVEVQGWSEVPRGVPLFESIVVFENYPVDSSLHNKVADFKIGNVRTVEQTNYPLTVLAIPGSELVLEIAYNCGCFDQPTITRMLGHLKTLLAGIVANPNQQLLDLPLLTNTERHQLLVEWNDIQADYLINQCIHEIFEAQVERSPDAIALVFAEKQLTYRELNARANQLAHHLQKLGVKPEVLVGICVERSLEMVVGILGILKAGGAYVPLDLGYPKERKAFILQDAQVPVLLSEQQLLKDLPEHQTKIVCLDRDWEIIAQQSQENPINSCTANNLAYLIYTSGSTGQPKGVLVNHGNVTRLFAATQSWFNFNSQDVWTLFHSIAFDFSVWEIWGALLCGGRLVVVPYFVSRSPESFYDLLCQQQVTVLNQTPSAFRQLIGVEESLKTAQQLALRLVIFGGEALEVQSLKPWFERHGDQFPQLVNMYGITETTVHVTYRPLTMTDLKVVSGSVIGRPIPDLQVYVLDQHRQPVPIGVCGEMYIGGAGLARGYLNRPELTTNKFIAHPYSHKPGDRLYRSGDLARYLLNGELEYLGRIDNQVKIRGFRIELGEIAAALNQHPQVRETVVVVREDQANDKRLVAYLVANSQANIATSDLGGFLQQKLPEYMIPAAFVILEALPLTSNGKVDRNALPAPDTSRNDVGYVPPRNPTEEALVTVYADVLGRELVGIHDNFFDLGGHSLLATRVISRLRQLFEMDLPLRNLFEKPTVAELADRIATMRLVSQVTHPPIAVVKGRKEIEL